ncbi:MAG: hypothetical protein ACOYXC_08180 [Candidatus Rifleibacteriota bacterium]
MKTKVMLILTLICFFAAGVCFAKSGLSFICGDGIVLGAALNGEWQDPHSIDKYLKGGELFRFFSIDGAGKEKYRCSKPYCKKPGWRLWKVSFTPEPANLITTTSTGLDAYFDSFEFAVCCDWNPVPRKITVSTIPNNYDIEAAQQHLTSLQEKIPGRFSQPELVIEQVIRGDFDGNGVDETLITASSVKGEVSKNAGLKEMFLPKNPSINDYSFIICRDSTNGPGKFYKLHEDAVDDIFNKFWKHRVGLVADLDGDGCMEIITQSATCQGGIYSMFRFNNGRPREFFGTVKN